MKSDFRIELEKLINKYSMEYDSDTPDFLLADYLIDCLRAFNILMIKRTEWYNKK